jgi:hypothetical protein
MTRPSAAFPPEDLFEAIGRLLEPGQREYFYQRMLYFRQLRPEDELLRLVEAIGLLALLIREAPHAVAREREQMAQLLETSLATIQAAADAGQAYQQQLDGRLTRLPADLAQGISPEAIARAMTESLRQQFVQSGVPATANALTAVSHQLTEATGHFQRAARQLSACTEIVDQARGAIDQMRANASRATVAAQSAVTELTQEIRVEGIRAVSWLCAAAWLLGILGGITFERWRGTGVEVVPQTIAIPTQVAEPSSSAESTPKKATPATPRDRRRTSPAPDGHDTEPPHGTVMEQGSNSDCAVKRTEHAKPKA